MKKGSKMTEEQRKKNQETQKRVWDNLELRKRHSEIHKGKHSSPKTEFKKGDIRLIGNKINVGRTPYNKGLTIKNGGLNLTLEERKRRSEETKKWWSSPENRKTRSEETKKLWEDTNYRDKLVRIHKELKQDTKFKKGHQVPEEIKRMRFNEVDFSELKKLRQPTNFPSKNQFGKNTSRVFFR